MRSLLALVLLLAAACGSETLISVPSDAGWGPPAWDAALEGELDGSLETADAGTGPDAGADAGGGADACLALAVPGDAFGASIGLSRAENGSYLPTVAARTGSAIVAWHEFVASQKVVRYAVVEEGCLRSVRDVVDPLGGGTRPVVAATSGGWALAWEAGGVPRLALLDPSGQVTTGPETLSAAGKTGGFLRISSSGDDLAVSWTDGDRHYVALRGPGETLPATDVGTTLQNGGLLNFPRVQLAPDGTLFLAYRDGPSGDADLLEVWLKKRPRGGAFGAAVNVSRSPDRLSDDIALALEPDGTLDVAWVEENPTNPDAFEVMHATRSPAGTLSAVGHYGYQGLWSWTPSIVPGLAAAWHELTSEERVNGTGGHLFFSAGPGQAPARILAPETGTLGGLARGADGALHLVFANRASPSQIRYSWKR